MDISGARARDPRQRGERDRVSDKLTVSEWFGPTFAGEGPSIGRRATFLRLGLCNLACAWCDTPYTWDWTGKNGRPQDKSALKRYDVEEIVKALAPIEQLLVITGGEPLIQQRGIARLLDGLIDQEVEIETNGTIWPNELGLVTYPHVRYNVSPKLDHANAATTGTDPINVAVLRQFARSKRANFKFVVTAANIDHDLREIAGIVADARIEPRDVWVMPEGRAAIDIDARTAKIADAVLAAGYNLTTRLHVIAWGDERGR